MKTLVKHDYKQKLITDNNEEQNYIHIYIFDNYIKTLTFNTALLMFTSILFLVTINTYITFKLNFFSTFNFI